MEGKHMAPLVVSYGIGVDSTALLIGLRERGIRPDLILSADTGGERTVTYSYLPIINRWLESVGFPSVTVVRYEVRDYRGKPPYTTLEQECLTNGGLPSEAFGFASCSIKWKQKAQHRFLKTWAPAIECWEAGGRVRKAIGFDCSPKEWKRTYKADSNNDPQYENWYPLQEWGWSREDCARMILHAGLPVPVKSACTFCPNQKPAEIRTMSESELKRIVVMEARAKPKLEKILGLWRNGCKGTRGGEKKPGRMTDFIMAEGLLPRDEIERLERDAPREIILRNEAHAKGVQVESWEEFFSRIL